MTTPPYNNNPYQNGQPQYGAPALSPHVAKDVKDAKTYGIIGIVAGVLGLLFPILAFPSLFCGIFGLKASNRAANAGVVEGNSKGLNITAIILGALGLSVFVIAIFALMFS